MKTLPAIGLSLLLFMAALSSQRPLLQETGPERHLKNLHQLTSGGENAEAYFSFDGTKLIFQSTRDGYPCDQIYTMNLDGTNVKRVSTGKGRTTCSYFLPDGKHFIYSSTHLASDNCPPKPSFAKGYVWAIDKDFDLFLSDFEGNLTQLTHTPGYDAEATVSPNGKKIVFSARRRSRSLFHELGGQ
jgi:Tol biopolymer transport system component